MGKYVGRVKEIYGWIVVIWNGLNRNGWENVRLWGILIKWGLIKGCGSVSATREFPKTRNPYFLIIYPLFTELSDNFTLAVNLLEC